MRKQLLLPIIILLFLIIGTFIVVMYGKGYRFGQGFEGPKLQGTGLLVATSSPDGAQVFINGHLTTATNNTINLSPDTYKIKIVKEGYFPWEKEIKVKKEVVSVTGALLFAAAPKLESITESGASDPVLDPSGTKIAFTLTSQTAKKNGIYVLDMSSRPILTLQSASTQITNDLQDSFSNAKLTWSPDGKELVATISASQDLTFPTTYLLKAGGFNENPQDVTETLENINAAWEEEVGHKENARLDSLNSKLKKLISENFNIASWSPDETKILYTASISATLPLIINPPLIGTDSTPQEREIEKNSIYVYDIKEDKNFKIEVVSLKFEAESFESPKPLMWFTDSKHLLLVRDRKIAIMEYDAKNTTIIYAGPFIDNYVFPWPDGSKLVILTNLGNTNIPPNLYTIGLK